MFCGFGCCGTPERGGLAGKELGQSNYDNSTKLSKQLRRKRAHLLLYHLVILSAWHTASHDADNRNYKAPSPPIVTSTSIVRVAFHKRASSWRKKSSTRTTFRMPHLHLPICRQGLRNLRILIQMMETTLKSACLHRASDRERRPSHEQRHHHRQVLHSLLLSLLKHLKIIRLQHQPSPAFPSTL